VVENSPTAAAPKAQYKLGLVLKELNRPFEAEEAFTKVLTNYPDSEWSQAAMFPDRRRPFHDFARPCV
jgi:TolA-binding protein